MSILSESGYPGWKDLQDEDGDFLIMIKDGALLYTLVTFMLLHLSESGYPGWKDVQDEEGIFWWCQWFKMVRYAVANTPYS